jgi:hypothetical protein
MMNSVLRLVTITLVLLASSVSADVTLEDHNQVTKTIDDATTGRFSKKIVNLSRMLVDIYFDFF